MKFILTKEYNVREITCCEMVCVLKLSGGNIHCFENQEMLENVNDIPFDIFSSWDWIQFQKPNKKVYLLSELKEIGKFIK